MDRLAPDHMYRFPTEAAKARLRADFNTVAYAVLCIADTPQNAEEQAFTDAQYAAVDAEIRRLRAIADRFNAIEAARRKRTDVFPVSSESVVVHK